MHWHSRWRFTRHRARAGFGLALLVAATLCHPALLAKPKAKPRVSRAHADTQARTPKAIPKGQAKAKAEAAPEPAPAATVPPIVFEKFSLKNGLEVILHPDRSLPLVAVNVWYHVGPANEPRGRSGFAHLFEHLMFEGSRHVGHEFDHLLESAGVSNSNGTTSWDRTNYFETVPRQHLDLVLWLESDRMGYMLDLVNQERLDVQRGVVQNERRQSYENAPYGPSTLTLLDTMFPKGHPYHGAVIGSMADLSAATLADVRAFFKAFYSPSNATIAIAGDFAADEVKRAIQHYFGSLPSLPKPARVHHATPPLTAAKRVIVEESVQLPKVSFGFIAPPAFGPDDPALEVASAVLAGGKATRLYQALVVDKKVATEVEASLESNELASIFSVSAVAATGKTVEALEQALDLELARLADQGPSAAELMRAKRRLLLDLSSNLQLLNGPGGESGRAGILQRFNHYLGEPGYLTKAVTLLNDVSDADVKRVVRQYLHKNARVSVLTRAKAGEAKP